MLTLNRDFLAASLVPSSIISVSNSIAGLLARFSAHRIPLIAVMWMFILLFILISVYILFYSSLRAALCGLCTEQSPLALPFSSTSLLLFFFELLLAVYRLVQSLIIFFSCAVRKKSLKPVNLLYIFFLVDAVRFSAWLRLSFFL